MIDGKSHAHLKSGFRLLALLLLGPAAGFTGLQTHIEFASPGSVSLTLDAWVPEGKGPSPAVIIVHGSGFARGDKQMYVKPLFPVLTDAGFAWFTINYRLTPQNHFPAPAQDVEAAVRWVKSHAREYKVDAKRLALTGESAGGHLVSYVGATSAAKLGVKAVVPFYAPYDLAGRARKQGAVNETIAQFLDVKPDQSEESFSTAEKASPINHVNRKMPPFLMIHGTEDKLVPLRTVARHAEEDAGNGANLRLLQGARRRARHGQLGKAPQRARLPAAPGGMAARQTEVGSTAA